CSIVAWITEIAVITAMIEATPATMPTSVSTLRSLLASSARSDIAKVSRAFIAGSLVAKRFDGIEPRAAPGRRHTGDHADHQRDEHRDDEDRQRQARGHDRGVEDRGDERGEHDADGAAEHADRRRLEQELEQDAAPGRTQRFADADLAGPLG